MVSRTQDTMVRTGTNDLLCHQLTISIQNHKLFSFLRFSFLSELYSHSLFSSSSFITFTLSFLLLLIIIILVPYVITIHFVFDFSFSFSFVRIFQVYTTVCNERDPTPVDFTHCTLLCIPEKYEKKKKKKKSQRRSGW